MLKSETRRKLVSLAVGAVALLLVTPLLPTTAAGPGEEIKETCSWSMTGVVSPGGVVQPGVAIGTQLLTLTCPNHIEIGEPQYGYKDCRSPIQPGNCTRTPLGDISVVDLGRVDDPTSTCGQEGWSGKGWTRSWLVTAPSVNLYTFWFRVHTFKDADCDKKPDDWNQDLQSPFCPGQRWSECPGFSDMPQSNIWRQSNGVPPVVVNYGDGALDGNPCYWHNTYYSGTVFNKPPAAGGLKDPRVPPYFPAPDGEVNECDWQNHEFQWRQVN